MITVKFKDFYLKIKFKTNPLNLSVLKKVISGDSGPTGTGLNGLTTELSTDFQKDLDQLPKQKASSQGEKKNPI